MKDFKTAYNKMRYDAVNAVHKALTRGCGVGKYINFAIEGTRVCTLPYISLGGYLYKVYNEPEHGNTIVEILTDADYMKAERFIITSLPLDDIVTVCDSVREWKRKY